MSTAEESDLLNAVFGESSDGLCLVAPDGAVLRANDKWLHATGLRREQLLGADVITLFAEEAREYMQPLLTLARAGERVAMPVDRRVTLGVMSFCGGSVGPVRMDSGVGLLIIARELSSQRLDRAHVVPRGETEPVDRASGESDDDRFRWMADSLPALVFEFDGPGSVSWLNKAWIEYTGMPLAAARGEGWQRCVHPEDLARVDGAARSAAVRGESSLLLTYRLRRADGGYRVFRGHNVFVRGAEGAPIKALHTAFDVTAELEACERAAESEARLARVLAASSDAFFDLDLDTGISTRSDGLARLLGREPADIPPNQAGFLALIHPDDVSSLRAELTACTSGQREAVDREVRARHLDGSWRWLRIRACVVPRASGTRLSFSGTLTDVTERRLAQDALRESEERLRSIFSTMSEGVVLQGASGRILSCNAAAERILGLTRAQMEGLTSVDARWQSVHEDGSPFPGENHPAMVSLRTGHPQRGVIMGVDAPEAGRRWISISSEPLRHAPDALPHAVVVTFADVTELRRGRERLERSEQRYRSLFENLREDVSVFEVERDVQGRVRDWVLLEANRQARSSFGEDRYRELKGRSLSELAEPAMRLNVERTDAILAGDVEPHELFLRFTDKHYLATTFALDEQTIVSACLDITDRVKAAHALREQLDRNEQMVRELRVALDHVKTLSGLLPICMHCHNIRNDQGYWDQIEMYISARTDATFTHGLCPVCEAKYYPEP